MKYFEYKIYNIWESDTTRLQKELNRLGVDGWKLVSKGRSDYQYIFIREKESNQLNTI